MAPSAYQLAYAEIHASPPGRTLRVRATKTTLAFGVSCLIALPAAAQVDQVVTPPANLVLSNYSSVPVGPFGGLESTAYVARVDDPSSAWFNPAGLARRKTPQISGSAGVYQHTSINPSALPNRGGSFQQLPNFVGFTFALSPNLTAGAALITINAWNQETDSEAIWSAPGSQQRFAYSADSRFERRNVAFGAGYGAGRWRAGGGLALSIMNVRLVQSASERVGTTAGLNSLLVTARTSGSAIQLRSQGGVQYDASQWQFGAAVRTPGLTIHRNGVVTFDGLHDAGASSAGASVFDPDADFEFHLPWEFQVGAAWVRDRVELEVDLQAYSSLGAYSMFASDQPVLIYTDAGTNQPPTAISRPFMGLTSASDSVLNVSAGGHVRLLKDRDIRLHLGVGSNHSPVAGEDMVFNNVDLMTWTVGFSGSLGRFQFSAGFNHQSGNATDVTLRNLLNGQVVRSDIDVVMTGFIYSLAFRF
jgi:hypothetical protein